MGLQLKIIGNPEEAAKALGTNRPLKEGDIVRGHSGPATKMMAQKYPKLFALVGEGIASGNPEKEPVGSHTAKGPERAPEEAKEEEAKEGEEKDKEAPKPSENKMAKKGGLFKSK